MGYLLLEGGAEFGGAMRVPDLRAIELAGGRTRLSDPPDRRRPDNNHVRAGNNGVRWFQSLGAHDVESLPLIDKASADDPRSQIHSVREIDLSAGGFTHYLGQTLKDSQAWQAALEAHQNGAVIAGSSAGQW